MIPINFNTTHHGFFENTNSWKKLCIDSKNNSYLADLNTNPKEFFMQRYLMESIVCDGLDFEINKFNNTEIEYLFQPKMSLHTLKYFSENSVEQLQFNTIKNKMVNTLYKYPSIILAINKEANSFSLNKMLNNDIIYKANNKKTLIKTCTTLKKM